MFHNIANFVVVVALPLSRPDSLSSRTEGGIIFLSLKPVDHTTRVGVEVEGRVDESSRLTDSSELYQSVGRLLERIDAISKSIDDISEVSSHILP